MTSINIRKLSHSEMDLYRKPLLPETWSCFPVDRDIDTQHLRKALQKDLDRIRSGAEKDPFSNSITMLALDISRMLEKNKLNYSALEALIQRLAVGSFGLRADRLKSYIGCLDLKKNKKKINKIIRSLAFNNKKLIDFEKFNEVIKNEVFGIVFTAHPTFGTTQELMNDLANLAINGLDNNEKNKKKLKTVIKQIFKTEQRPQKNITLDYEHNLSMVALEYLQDALGTFYSVFLDVSKDLYPDDFHKIEPHILRLHTWVGYDVDGRGDIFWNDSFSKRLKVKINQLKIYEKNIDKILSKVTSKILKSKLSKIKLKISNAISSNQKVLKSFEGKGFLSNFDDIKHISNFMHKNKEKLLTTTKPLIFEIQNIINDLKSENTREKNIILDEIILFKILIINCGLGLGRTQFRLNANQLNNAISREVHLTGDPDDPSNKRSYLRSLSKLIDNVKPVQINFGSIVEENMNARRYFMLIKQVLKYIDEDQSIRFLIAECDYSLTVMTALYFSKMFGVEDKVDISPLFETEKGLESGHAIINTLLKNKHFRNYIIKRKKITIQTGYSDAGRYLGQSAAVLSIENLQRKIANTLVENNISGVKLLIFNTHGESIGRGGHPVSLDDRLRYVCCNYTKKKTGELEYRLD